MKVTQRHHEQQELAWLVGARHRHEKVTIESLATQFVNLRSYRVAESDLASNPSDAAIKAEVGPHQWLYPPKRSFDFTPESFLAKCGHVRIRSSVDRKNLEDLVKKLKTVSKGFAAKRLERLMRQQGAWARTLQKLWKKPLDKAAVDETLDQIFSPQRLAGAWPVFQLHVGTPVFQPRDLLDNIAYTILGAWKRGLLRKCKGSVRGWECPMPYLVAHENRNKFCSWCAEKSLLQSKTASRKRRQRAS